MTAIAGTTGSVILPGTPYVGVASITQWDLTTTADNYNADVFGITWHQFVIGIQGWSGNLTGFYDIPNDPSGQLVLWNALYLRQSVVLSLQTNPGGGLFEGTAHVTQAVITTPVNNIIAMTMAFVGNGSLNVNFA